MEEREPGNGIDGSTGRYLSSLRGQKYTAPPTDPAALREYQWWVERYGIDDPNRAPMHTVDPKSLSSAGWAVVYAPEIASEIKEALAPLLRRREEQAGPYFKTFLYEKGQTKRDFLKGKAEEGPANPKKVPYYVLLVGDPRSIPFSFQYELDVQYAVGRLHLAKPEDYAVYARSVVAAETCTESPRPRQVTLFGARNPDDRATSRTATQLVEPLAAALKASTVCKWPVRALVGEEASKAQLARILGGPETPALLFTATHGMAYPDQPEEMLRAQGALLCQNWPGPQQWQKEIPRDFYFSGDDVSCNADLLGLIAFHFACYSAGTPDMSDFEAPILGQRQAIASYPFLSRLAQRLLSHPRGGALAVLGHIDRAWTQPPSETKTTRRRPRTARSMLSRACSRRCSTVSRSAVPVNTSIRSMRNSRSASRSSSRRVNTWKEGAQTSSKAAGGPAMTCGTSSSWGTLR